MRRYWNRFSGESRLGLGFGLGIVRISFGKRINLKFLRGGLFFKEKTQNDKIYKMIEGGLFRKEI